MPFQRHFITFGPGPGHWVVGLLLMIVFWSVLIFAIWAVVRHFSSHSHSHAHGYHAPSTPPPSGDSPLDVLRMRFARGEINEDEYKSRVDLLQRGR